MKIVECSQGSDEWLQARLGIPTASQFHRLLTPKTMRPSGSAEKYLYELLAEWALGFPLQELSTGFIERGSQMELDAVRYYELQRDLDTEAVGFCLTDDGIAGCSPDRLVGDRGLLEIKCPSAHVQVAYLLGEPEGKHRCQVQGQLWVTGREWCDLLCYNPDLPPAVVRVERDEVFMAKLAEILEDFGERLRKAKTRLKELGAVHAGET
jgi:hypothetical protein